MSSGGEFLTRKSDLTKTRQSTPGPSDVLIVEDEAFDANRLSATLRLLLGYEVSIRRASTLAHALDRVMERMPEIVFLDDYLKPSDTAMHSIPYLRRAGFSGPIIIISGQVDRQRRFALIGAGADDVIHKDDVDSVRVGEALERALAGGSTRPDDVQP